MNDMSKFGVSAAGMWVNLPVVGQPVHPAPMQMTAAYAAIWADAAITPKRERPTATATATSVDRGSA